MSLFRNAALSGALMLAMAAALPAATIWTASLTGANEVPAVNTAATGFATISLTGNLLTISLTYSGLSAPATAGHIHCCTAFGTNVGVALPFTGLPNTTSGAYTNSFDLTNAAVYTSAFITASGGTVAAAEAALIAGMNSNMAYANLHNVNNPGGEIRGEVTPTPEPTSAALSLIGLGLALVGGRRYQLRRQTR